MSSYKELAIRDVMMCKLVLNSTADPIMINYAAYHLHQAIEKQIKSELELEGNDISQREFRTHTLDYLVERLEDENKVPQKIRECLYIINRWVSEPRYNINFRQSVKMIEELLEITEQWINQ